METTRNTTPVQEELKGKRGKSATETIRESNEELELFLASFGEQKDQAIVLEKLIFKEFKDLTREVTLVHCP